MDPNGYDLNVHILFVLHVAMNHKELHSATTHLVSKKYIPGRKSWQDTTTGYCHRIM